MTAYHLVSVCDHGHQTCTDICHPSFDGNRLIDGVVGSDAHFCPVCESPRMTPLGYHPADEPPTEHVPVTLARRRHKRHPSTHHPKGTP